MRKRLKFSALQLSSVVLLSSPWVAPGVRADLADNISFRDILLYDEEQRPFGS